MAYHAQRTGVGVGVKATGVTDKGGQVLVLLHLETHRAFHFPVDLDQDLIGGDNHHIAFLKADVILDIAFHDELVDVDRGDVFAVTYQLHIAEAAYVADSTRTVKRMEDSREGRKGVSARLDHFTHHIDLDGTDAAQSQTDVGSGVVRIIKTIIYLV